MSSSSPSPSCCHVQGTAGLADGMERELAMERTRLRRKVSVAALLTALVMLSSLPHMLGGGHHSFLPPWFTSPWTQCFSPPRCCSGAGVTSSPAPSRPSGSIPPT